MDTPALLPLLFLFNISPSLSKLFNTKGRKDIPLPPPLPSTLTAALPPRPICHLRPNTPLPLRENGYYLYSPVPSMRPSSSPHLFTNAKRSSEPRLQSPM